MSPTYDLGAEPPGERAPQVVAAILYLLQQPVALDHQLHRKRGGGRDRMADVGVAVLKQAAALAQGIDDAALGQHRADRLVAATEALGDRHQVGRHALLLDRVQRAGAAHAAHHLVGDVENAVAITQRAHAAKVAGSRRHRAERRADHGLGDEGDHALGADLLEGSVEFCKQPLGVVVLAFVVAPLAVFVAG